MKLEWGKKVECPSCGVIFYDMRKTDLSCPHCDTKFKQTTNTVNQISDKSKSQSANKSLRKQDQRGQKRTLVSNMVDPSEFARFEDEPSIDNDDNSSVILENKNMDDEYDFTSGYRLDDSDLNDVDNVRNINKLINED